MFLKHTPFQVIDDCVIHQECSHTFQFVRYDHRYDKNEKIIIRLRCDCCYKEKINDWYYYRVSVDYWLGFILTHSMQDFTSAN